MLLALIIAFPLAGWLILGVVGGRLPRRVIGIFASGTVALAFVVSVAASRHPAVSAGGLTAPLFSWISVGTLTVTAGLLMDRLSSLMALVVTGVGFLIHVYSIGYMADDRSSARYFAYLNLFIASMLLLVLGSNLLVLFVGWELVGLCSYLLIGFWFDRERAAQAGRKAFVVNRIGDAGFLLGILLLATSTGTLEFGRIGALASQMVPGLLTAITLLLFVGATGKSAQLPLYVWLPDAMEGPTPVSALIHAATMVTAGVYMIARLHPLFITAPLTLPVVAGVGAATAFFAATIALVQWDLKRVLAYSTISQLGYMFVAMGVVAMPAGMFHLTTHAFFKALLFLAAGSVMHAMGGVIDMRQLGGLAGAMRWTALGFVIGALALAGIPPFAGFFSKDLILEAAFTSAQHGGSWLVWVAGLATAFVTAVYVTRAAILTFLPPAAHHGHPHEAPPTMRWPMAVLAVLSVGGGALGAQAVGAPLLHSLDRFFAIAPAAESAPAALLTMISVAIGALGIVTGAFLYRGRREVTLGAVGRFFEQQWYVDHVYEAVILAPARALAHFCADVIETRGIDGAVNGVAALVVRAGGTLRQAQTGYVRSYAAAILAGTIVVLGYWLLR